MARKRRFCTRRFRAVLVFLGFALPMIVWLPSVLLLLGGWIRGHSPVMICASVLRLCWPGFSVGLVSSGIGLQRVFFPSGISLQWNCLQQVFSSSGIGFRWVFSPAGLAFGGCFPRWDWLPVGVFPAGLAFSGCFPSMELVPNGIGCQQLPSPSGDWFSVELAPSGDWLSTGVFSQRD